MKPGDQLNNFVAHRWPPGTCPSSLLDLLTGLPGWTSSPGNRRLNPRFVDLLMGWPIGWTDCASPVTGYPRWLQRMRTALSELPSTAVITAEGQWLLAV